MDPERVTAGIFAPQAMLPDGWHENVSIYFSADGCIADAVPDTQPGSLKVADGPVIPGMPNVHSHAFQRAMAGRGQQVSKSGDTFWTWRESMYDLALSLEAADFESVAAYVYLEMLKAGYTAVGEFHYVHHQPDGAAYDPIEELAIRIIRAAEFTGIRTTVLPVLYRRSGFNSNSTLENQRRFLLDVPRYISLFQDLRTATSGLETVMIGFAAHSLRAVSQLDLRLMLAARAEIAPQSPVHIHVAEQQLEVQECLAVTGMRPIEWLLRHFDLDSNWCLIHSTHASLEELVGIAATGAVVGLCPTTEADLGDGFFPLPDFLKSGGSFAIGSDSHIRVNAPEELRFLEYQARLHTQRRNVLQDRYLSTGEALYREAVRGGSRALGIGSGTIQKGQFADLVVLEGKHPLLANRSGSDLLDSYVFALGSKSIRDVFVHGRHIIDNGRHANEDQIAENMRKVMNRQRST